jgi:hypothetical protein
MGWEVGIVFIRFMEIGGFFLHHNLQQSTHTAVVVHSMNVFFPHLYGIFYIGNHPLGFLKGKEFLD